MRLIGFSEEDNTDDHLIWKGDATHKLSATFRCGCAECNYVPRIGNGSGMWLSLGGIPMTLAEELMGF